MNDCGLFAAVVCIALALSLQAKPSHMRWDLSLMRSDLSKCLVHHHLTVFPILNTGIEHLNVRNRKKLYFRLYCLSIPKYLSKDDLVRKSVNCNEWLHIPCLDFSDEFNLSNRLFRYLIVFSVLN